MNETVVFYQLTEKFVSSEMKIPDQSRQVIYYSLAIGHHVGVMDCFKKIIDVPLKEFENWVACLPEGAGRRKLEGISKWGEIEINRSHVIDLLQGINQSLEMSTKLNSQLPYTLAASLKMMMDDPALYLMGRKV
jgi:hydrogenase-4 component J